MDETTVIEPEATNDQSESEVVNTGDQNVSDVWQEDGFDNTETMEVQSDKPTDEVPTETVDENTLEYVTEGLSPLDSPLVVKRHGKLYDLTDMNQIRDLVERGLDSTVKNQELADMRRELQKERNPDVSEQELDNLGVTGEVEGISQEILNSSYADSFKGVVNGLPENTLDELKSNPNMLRGLSQDVKSGLAQKIMPNVNRYMDVDGMSFKEAYMKSGQEVMSKQNNVSKSMNKLISEPKTSNNIEVKEKSIWDIEDSEFRSLMDTQRR